HGPEPSTWKCRLDRVRRRGYERCGTRLRAYRENQLAELSIADLLPREKELKRRVRAEVEELHIFGDTDDAEWWVGSALAAKPHQLADRIAAREELVCHTLADDSHDLRATRVARREVAPAERHVRRVEVSRRDGRHARPHVVVWNGLEPGDVEHARVP